MLRQDPDVVMVGEIRDRETAEIAVQASLTGHLVLSTLHTNTAVGAFTRLRDMGIEPFLLASSLIGVLAQRLVRVLCPHCKVPHKASSMEAAFLGLKDAQTFTAAGCAQCNNTGYKGRTGIYELLTVDEKVRQMIHGQEAEEAIVQIVRPTTRSIRDDGILARARWRHDFGRSFARHSGRITWQLFRSPRSMPAVKNSAACSRRTALGRCGNCCAIADLRRCVSNRR